MKVKVKRRLSYLQTFATNRKHFKDSAQTWVRLACGARIWVVMGEGGCGLTRLICGRDHPRGSKMCLTRVNAKGWVSGHREHAQAQMRPVTAQRAYLMGTTAQARFGVPSMTGNCSMHAKQMAAAFGTVSTSTIHFKGISDAFRTQRGE